MHYSTIKRDSNLLNRGREIDNRRDMDNAFDELVKSRQSPQPNHSKPMAYKKSRTTPVDRLFLWGQDCAKR
jgi:hypothetical protein